MKHEIIQEKLWLFFDPEFDEQERIEIQDHLIECSQCRQMVEKWDVLRKGFKQENLAKGSEAFVERVMDNRVGEVQVVGALGRFEPPLSFRCQRRESSICGLDNERRLSRRNTLLAPASPSRALCFRALGKFFVAEHGLAGQFRRTLVRRPLHVDARPQTL